MFFKGKLLILLLIISSSHLAHSRGMGISHVFQDQKGNFAYSQYTQDGTADINLQQATLGGGNVKGVNDNFSPEPSKSASREILQPEANSRRHEPPVYPPINKNLLYSMGYIYVKDFSPQSDFF
ncbi:uncharacterized protein LOC111083341 [Limulus polyphemus]|uniref:Uncharacterized protein LOC111083341 n=1 Tax=Limulus polyphemus TaxID=6850 RepID=A0ABM1RVW8_LIMPO|nr:uncharacterized protein LOC111083341 [Limulus polyphemus]